MFIGPSCLMISMEKKFVRMHASLIAFFPQSSCTALPEVRDLGTDI